jgi:hypothetical protein
MSKNSDAIATVWPKRLVPRTSEWLGIHKVNIVSNVTVETKVAWKLTTESLPLPSVHLGRLAKWSLLLSDLNKFGM